MTLVPPGQCAAKQPLTKTLSLKKLSSEVQTIPVRSIGCNITDTDHQYFGIVSQYDINRFVLGILVLSMAPIITSYKSTLLLD